MLGTGTSGDPYQIVTLANFKDIRLNASSKYYKLMADIDFANGNGDDSNGYVVSNLVNCTIDGNGHKVKNFYQNGQGGGMFYDIFSSVFKNIGFENITITHTNIASAGAIARQSTGNPTFDKVYVTGAIDIILASTASCWAGGFIGELDVSSGAVNFTDCYNLATVKTKNGVTNGPYSGGFAGRVQQVITVNLTNCYAAGALLDSTTHNTRKPFLGTRGSATISCTNCYNDSTVNNFTEAGVTNLTTTQLKAQNMGTNFGLNGARNNGYPYLKLFYPPDPVIESRNVKSYAKKVFSGLTKLIVNGRVASSHVAKIESTVSTSRQATVEVGSFVKPINAKAEKTNPKYILTSFVKTVSSAIEVVGRKKTVEIKSTAGTIKSSVSNSRIATISGTSYVRQIESEALNGRKFKTEVMSFVSPLNAKAQVSVKVKAESYVGKITATADLEGNNFKLLRSKVKKIRSSATPIRNHIVVLESFMRGIRSFASTQIKDKILAKLNLNTDWTDKVIVGDTIKITLDIESKSGSQSHVVDGTLKIMDSERNVLVTYELGDLEEISFGIYELLYTVPDGYGPLYAEFTALTDEYPIATRLKLDRQWVV